MRRTIPVLLATAAAMALTATSAFAEPPANDAFASPSATSGIIRGDFSEATREVGEPDHGFQSVWYTFRAPTSGRYAVWMTPDSEYGAFTFGAIYTGDSVSALQPVGTAQEGMARIVFEATAGTVYRIAVTTLSEGREESFSGRVGPAPLPANDDFAGAQRVKIPGRYQGTFADATAELGEPHHDDVEPAHSLWYRFRPSRTGRLSIQASTPVCDASVAVYTGSQLSSLRRRASALGRTVRFTARRGKSYYVAVDCGYRTVEDFELTISDGSIAGKGVTIEPVAGQTVDSVIERGLRTVVEAKRKTTVGIELILSSATARALGIDRRVIGRARGTLGYRQKLPAAIRLSSEARKALAGEASLSASLRVTLLKSNAPNRVLTVPVRLPN